MRMAATVIHRGIGWLPCVPFAYNEMTGEPIAQCNSISDQTPCAFGPPLAYGGYCPTGMPGGLGFASAPPLGAGLPGYTDPADPCGYGNTLDTGSGVCLPDSSPVLSEIVSSRIISAVPLAQAKASTDYTWWIVGGVLALVAVVAVARR